MELLTNPEVAPPVLRDSQDSFKCTGSPTLAHCVQSAPDQRTSPQRGGSRACGSAQLAQRPPGACLRARTAICQSLKPTSAGKSLRAPGGQAGDACVKIGSSGARYCKDMARQSSPRVKGPRLVWTWRRCSSRARSIARPGGLSRLYRLQHRQRNLVRPLDCLLSTRSRRCSALGCQLLRFTWLEPSACPVSLHFTLFAPN